MGRAFLEYIFKEVIFTKYKKEEIIGFKDYQIDTNGIIYSKKNKPLKPSINHNGYQIVNFCINHKRFGLSVHTLVAKQFIPNDDERKTQINHKDGNKQNNNVDNLEWVTPSENMRHSVDALGKHLGKNNGNARKIIGKNKNGDTLEFDSLMDCVRFFNPGRENNERHMQTSLWKALNGHSKTYKGYYWKYKD